MPASRFPLALLQDHPRSTEHDPLGGQQRTFQRLTPAVSPEPAASGHHPMTRDIGATTRPHDVPDGAPRAWASGQFGNIAVRGDTTGRNASDDRQNLVGEAVVIGLLTRRNRRRQANDGAAQRNASDSGWPSAFGSAMPTIAASVGAMSAGDTARSYEPGLTPWPKSTIGTC
jgi:hypothetical protein